MDHAGEGALPVLVFQDVAGLVVGVARVDNQRQASLTGGYDVGPEALGLLVARAVVVMEVEAGLADAHHLGMARRRDQPVGVALPLVLGLVRMDADRAPDIVVPLGDGADALELVEARADRQHGADSRRLRARQHARLVDCELGKVEMTMAVDQHVRPRPLVRRSVGRHPAVWAAPFQT